MSPVVKIALFFANPLLCCVLLNTATVLCSIAVLIASMVFPQVDENGKIHRLRRECPADECGAGVFMASHFDRHYCGKCCLTYCFNKPEDK